MYVLYHYRPLDDVLDTDDTHRPSAQLSHKHIMLPLLQLITILEKQQKDPELFTGQHAGTLVSCQECSQPRVIYSMRLLSSHHQTTRAEALSDADYTCGSPILEPRINCPGQYEMKDFKDFISVVHMLLPKEFKTVCSVCDTLPTRSGWLSHAGIP